MFTIIVNIDTFEKKEIEKFVEKINKQTSDEFELILLIQKFSYKTIKLFEKIERINEDKLKICFSTRKKSFTSSMLEAAKLSKGKHILFATINTIEKNNFIEQINKVIHNSNEADLIELKTNINGQYKWNPKTRSNVQFNKIYDLSNTKTVIPYIMPFGLNKIYKTNLVKKIIKDNCNFVKTSNNWMFDFLYAYILNIKNYLLSNNSIIKLRINAEDLPSYKNSIEQWNEIQNLYNKNKNYLVEIEYAKWYFFKIILIGFYSNKNVSTLLSSNKVIIFKIEEYIEKKLLKNNPNFNLVNPYMFYRNIETEILSKNNYNTKTLNLLEE